MAAVEKDVDVDVDVEERPDDAEEGLEAVAAAPKIEE